MRHDGGLLIAFGAMLGLLVSIYNYFSPQALLAPTVDIAGTPAALVTIAATLALFLAGLVLGGAPRSLGLTAFLVVGCAVGIAGTALAASLVESPVLGALMLVCAVGLALRLFTRRSVA